MEELKIATWCIYRPKNGSIQFSQIFVLILKYLSKC